MSKDANAAAVMPAKANHDDDAQAMEQVFVPAVHGDCITSADAIRVHAMALWNDAWKWTLDHPNAWATIRDWCLDRASRGEVSVQISEVVRGAKMDDKPARFSNTYVAAWSRMLIVQCPQLRGKITLNPSMFDMLHWDTVRTESQPSIFDLLDDTEVSA